MRPLFLVASLVVLAACGGGSTVSAPRPSPRASGGGGSAAPVEAVVSGAPLLPPEWGLAGRAKATTGARAMVVSGHPLASEVGIEILKQGGNAVDAAVAVGFALEVVLPEAGNIGGGGFIVYRDATGRVRALDYRETAPAGASRDMYLDSAGHVTERSLTGHLASGVPGSVAGVYEAWKKYGRRPWATLIAPAIRLAEGHMLDAVRSRDLEAEADRLRLFPASARQFLVEGHAPAPGAMFRQPELARTLRLIADSGPDVFYRGQIADSIVAEMQRDHGLITKNDLAGSRAQWRTPVAAGVRGGGRREPRDDALFGRRRRRQRRGGDDHAERRLRQRGHGPRRGVSPEQRNGRLRRRAGPAQPIRPGAGRSERDRPEEAHALGDDAVDRAGSRRQAVHGGRDARRTDDHHQRVSGDRERRGLQDVAGGRGGRAAHPSSGAPRHHRLRAQRAAPGGGGFAEGDGP